jgi:hypothetical protein
MNVIANPLVMISGPQSSLGDVLAALEPHAEKSLVIEYGGRDVQAGYHVTEVKAGSFVTLDCGANADAWRETILQVEDIPPKEGGSFMTAGKFRSILAQVDRKVRLNAEARLTFEIGAPSEPMQVFDVASLAIDGDTARLQLGARPAICKPRHRAAQTQTQAEACCGPSAKAAGCC